MYPNNNNDSRPPFENHNQCICCPYGGLSAIPVVFSIVAMFFSYICCYGCDTFGSQSYETNLHVGYYTIEDLTYRHNGAKIYEYIFHRCITYPNEQYFLNDDIVWIFNRRVISILTFSCFIIFIFICILSCNCCLIYPRKCIIVFGGIIIIHAQCHLLLLSGLKSDICEELDCTLRFGGYCIIMATASWMIVGCTLFCFKDKVYYHSIQKNHHHNNYNHHNNNHHHRSAHHHSSSSPHPSMIEQAVTTTTTPQQLHAAPMQSTQPSTPSSTPHNLQRQTSNGDPVAVATPVPNGNDQA